MTISVEELLKFIFRWWLLLHFGGSRQKKKVGKKSAKIKIQKKSAFIGKEKSENQCAEKNKKNGEEYRHIFSNPSSLSTKK